jgi:hypothetical protein
MKNLAFPDKVKTVCWAIGGALIAVRAEITQATSWVEFFSPFVIVTFLSGGLFALTSYWSKSPVPVAGQSSNQSESEDAV